MITLVPVDSRVVVMKTLPQKWGVSNKWEGLLKTSEQRRKLVTKDRQKRKGKIPWQPGHSHLFQTTIVNHRPKIKGRGQVATPRPSHPHRVSNQSQPHQLFPFPHLLLPFQVSRLPLQPRPLPWWGVCQSVPTVPRPNESIGTNYRDRVWRALFGERCVLRGNP